MSAILFTLTVYGHGSVQRKLVWQLRCLNIPKVPNDGIITEAICDIFLLKTARYYEKW